MKKNSKLKLKIPPPVVTLVFSGLMYLVNTFSSFGQGFFLQSFLVLALLIVSCVLLLPAAIEFYKKKTTVNPFKPEKTSVLVVEGVYKYSRNPMYLGMACLLAAWALWLGNPFNSLVFVAYIVYMNKFQIIVEELALHNLFGDEYVQYKNKVRRWI